MPELANAISIDLERYSVYYTDEHYNGFVKIK